MNRGRVLMDKFCQVKNTKIFCVICVLLISIMSSVYFYGMLNSYPTPIHSDDAGTLTAFRNVYAYGMSPVHSKLGGDLSIFSIINKILYHVIGATKEATQLAFALRYFLCILPTLFLCMFYKNRSAQWVGFPFCIYMILFPQFDTLSKGITSYKYHVDPTIIFLFSALVYYLFITYKEKKYLFLLCLCVLCGGLCGDILIMTTVVIPYFLYWQIQSIVRKKNYLLLKIDLFIIAIMMAAMKVLITVKGNMFYTGYGSRIIEHWEYIGKNLILWIKGVIGLFNAEISGEIMISYGTVYKGFRLIIVAIMLILAIKILVDFCKGKDYDVISILCSLAVLSSSMCFLVTRTDIESEEVARYFNVVAFALPVLTVRWFILNNVIKNVKTGYIFIVGGLLIFSMAEKVTMVIEDDAQIQAVNKLEDLGLSYGIGNFWSSNVISMYSNYDVQVQAVYYDDDDGLIQPMHLSYIPYQDKNNLHNFIILDDLMTLGISRDKMVDIYGKPKKDIHIKDREILIYDYDIRCNPLQIDYENHFIEGEGFKVSKYKLEVGSGGYIKLPTLFLETGQARITVVGKNLDENNIDLYNAETNEKIEYDFVQDAKKCIFVLQINGRENVDIYIRNNKNDSVCFEKASIVYEQMGKELWNAEKFSKLENLSTQLNKGTFKLVIMGNNIKDAECMITNDDFQGTCTLISAASERLSYEILSEKEQMISLEIKNGEGNISKICYENNENGICFNNIKYDTKDILYWLDGKDGRIRMGENAGKDSNGIILLKSGSFIYGPYISLERGVYTIELVGENLNSIEYSLTYDTGNGNIYSKELYRDDSRVLIGFSLTEDVNDWELVINNDTKDDKVKISNYKVKEGICFNSSSEVVKKIGEESYDQSLLCINEQNERIFGPYIPLGIGRYEIEFSGKGLDGLNYFLTADAGEKTLDLMVKEKGEERVLIEVDINDPVENFEVIAEYISGSDKLVYMEKYTLTKVEEGTER